MNRIAALLTVLAGATTNTTLASDADFVYRPPGTFAQDQKGTPRPDRAIYARDITFPVRFDPSLGEKVVLNSQVYQTGKQCDPANYVMPWTDTYCESRHWPMPLCPTAKGHQGVDIRPVRCVNKQSVAVAVEAGTIARVTPYSNVELVASAGGRRWRYLHLDSESIRVRPGDRVQAGDPIGTISNIMDRVPSTSVHLHLDVQSTVRVGDRPTTLFVPPYSSLIVAYRRAIGLPPLDEDGTLGLDPIRERP